MKDEVFAHKKGCACYSPNSRYQCERGCPMCDCDDENMDALVGAKALAPIEEGTK